jgi:hypothetical protein
MTDIIRLTTLDNLDEQLSGEAREFILVREEGYADRNYSKEEAEQIIAREHGRKKLITDGYMPLGNEYDIGKYIVQNMSDKKIVLSPEVIARNDMSQEMQIDINLEYLLRDTVMMEWHNNCLPLMQSYMQTPENNSYSFKHAGCIHNFKFWWPEVMTNKIVFIGRNYDYENAYTRCNMVEGLRDYYEFYELADTRDLISQLGKRSSDILYIDPFGHAAFDSGLETIGTLAHKKSFEDFIAGMKKGVSHIFLQLGGYKYKDYYKYVKTAFDNDYIFCYCETVPDILVSDTPEFADWYISNYDTDHFKYRHGTADEKVALRTRLRNYLANRGATDVATEESKGYVKKYTDFIARVAPIITEFQTKLKLPASYAEYFQKVKGPAKFGTCLDLSTPKAVKDALPAVKKYCKCVLADREFLTNIRFPVVYDKVIETWDAEKKKYLREPDTRYPLEGIKDLRWDKLYIARDDATESILACATVSLSNLIELNPGLTNLQQQQPIVQFMATGRYKKNTGRDLVPLGGTIPITSVVYLSKVRATKAMLGYF